jgi:esterase/lipase
MMILTYIVASYQVYIKTLSRVSKDVWSRDIPSSLEPQSVKMYELGLKWSSDHIKYKKDVHIISEGLNLYGEYYDFGKKTCAIILSGRTESLKYGYFFAAPYSLKCNILVLDPRGHGLSDGKFNTIGFEESKDIKNWINFMHQEFGLESFVLHGICIGAAGGIFSITLRECPYVKAIITEGMFPRFYESMKNNLIEKKKPVFIFIDLIDFWMKHFTKHSMKFGPLDVIDKLDVPLLMLHSKQDLHSKPDYAKKLFDKAGSKVKELVWFDIGKHSMIRINNMEKYDSAIIEFLDKISL